jgi:hypothetical protein
MPFATVDDYTARHGAADEGTITELLADASSLILDAIEGTSAAWAVEEVPDDVAVPRTVTSITCQVAHRAYMNPGGLSRQQLGDASQSFNSDTPDALYLTDGERRRLKRVARASTFRAVTMSSPYSGRNGSEDPELTL